MTSIVPVFLPNRPVYLIDAETTWSCYQTPDCLQATIPRRRYVAGVGNQRVYWEAFVHPDVSAREVLRYFLTECASHSRGLYVEGES
jgi:hypothetical protein